MIWNGRIWWILQRRRLHVCHFDNVFVVSCKRKGKKLSRKCHHKLQYNCFIVLKCVPIYLLNFYFRSEKFITTREMNVVRDEKAFSDRKWNIEEFFFVLTCLSYDDEIVYNTNKTVTFVSKRRFLNTYCNCLTI